MNILLIVNFWIFTVSTYGELDGTYQNLKINTNEFNQTDFLSSILIHENTTTKELVYKIDGSQNNNDKTLTVHIANPIELNEGVLNFNSESKLAIPMLSKLADGDNSSSTATTPEAATTTTTTTEATTATTTTTASGTNITTTTTTNGTTDTAATATSTTSTSSLSNATNSTASVTPLPILPTG
jgi:hypothetical protein